MGASPGLLRSCASLHLKARVASVFLPANLGLGELLGTGTHRPEASGFGLATKQVENCQAAAKASWCELANASHPAGPPPEVCS